TSLSPLANLITPAGPQDIMRVTIIQQALTALDPFRIWFWAIVLVGLAATSQLRGWRAWSTVTFCWIVGAAVRCGLAVAMLPRTEALG
ncbi:MAG: hypothetical protein JXO22_09640, partial [Phycisphaerae bacterium]|nr:hypothetical protein [Phycisphaerae bacterium]